MSCRWYAGLLVGAVLALCASAQAQEEAPAAEAGESQLAAIREQVLYARYADAERALTQFNARPDLTPALRNEALEIHAIILLARRQRPRAEAVLRELYGRDPDHRLIDRDVGPDVRAAFERARDSHPTPATVTLENVTTPLETRRSPAISVRIDAGADLVQELRISYRNSATGGFERVVMRFDDEERVVGNARVPLMEGTEAYEVQYFVEALAPSQAVIGTLGSRTEPLTLSVPEEIARVSIIPTAAEGSRVPQPAGGSVAEEWWFWTLIGVVVAGGAVGLGLGFGLQEQIEPGTLGVGEL